MAALIDYVQHLISQIPPWAYVGLMGILLAGWRKTQDTAAKLLTYVWAQDSLDERLTHALLYDLHAENTPMLHFGYRGFFMQRVSLKTSPGMRLVAFRQVNLNTIFWYRWRGFLRMPLIIHPNEGSTYIIRYIRGTLDTIGMIRKTIARENDMVEQTKRSRFKVTRLPESNAHAKKNVDGPEEKPPHLPPSGGGLALDYRVCRPLDIPFSDIGEPPSMGHVSNLWLDTTAQELFDDAKRWYSNRTWYESRSLAWRRGYLLHGPPGSGKTSLVRALALELNLPVFILDLRSMTNSDLHDAWSRALCSSPAIVLIEDIDAVYRGRTPISPGQAIQSPPSFDWLLNVLDGVEQQDGILVCLSTNNLDKVDTAIGGTLKPDGLQAERPQPRPGRIDKLGHLSGYFPEEGRRHIANRILAGSPLLIAQVVREGEGDTPARFQERCVRTALADREGLVPDLSGLETADYAADPPKEPERPKRRRTEVERLSA